MGHRRGTRTRALLLAAMAWVWLFAAAGPAAADYDPQQAGHPLRIVAYVLHPIGVALDYLIFRPAYWLGSKEPLRTIFGVGDAFSADGQAPPPPPPPPRHSPPPPPVGVQK
jgi:hypothetical protein